MEIEEAESDECLVRKILQRKSSESGFSKRITGLFLLYKIAVSVRNGRFCYYLRIIEGLQFFHIALTIMQSTFGTSENSEGAFFDLLRYTNNGLAMYPLMLNYLPEVRHYLALFIIGLIWLTFLLVFCSFFYFFQRGVTHFLSFYMLDFLSHILYVPFVGLLINSITGVLNEEEEHEQEQGKDSFEEIHKILAILSIVTVLLTVALVALYKLVVFNQSVSNTYPMARLANTTEVHFHIIRTILIMLINFNPILKSHVLVLICYMIGSLYLFWAYLFDSTIYDIYAERLMSIFAGVYVGMGILACILVLIKASLSLIIGGYINIILLVFLLRYSLNRKLTHDLTLNCKHARKEETAIRAAISLIRIIKVAKFSNTKVGSTLVLQYLTYHFEKCKQPFCPISFLFNNKTTNIATDRDIIVKKLEFCSNKEIKAAVFSFPKAIKLRLLYVSFLISIKENQGMAWRMISIINSMHLGIIDNMHIYSQKKILKDESKASSGHNTIKAYSVITHKKLELQFLKEVGAVSEITMQFWATLQESAPSLFSFMEICNVLDESILLVRKLWSAIERKGQISSTILLYYSRFCEEILDDGRKAIKIKKRVLENKEQILHNINFKASQNEEGAAIITISAKENSIGIIKQYNAAFCQISGYDSNNLFGCKINALIPSIYIEAHESAFQQACYILESGETISYSEKETYMMHVSKYIIPISIKVLKFPHFANNYMYVTAITQSKEASKFEISHLLLNSKMQIIGITSNCIAHLGLSVDDIRNREMDITSIIPDFNLLKEGQKRSCNCMTNESEERVFECMFQRILTAKKQLLGYEVKVWKDCILDEKCDLSRKSSCIAPTFSFEFRYNESHNKYVAHAKDKMPEENAISESFPNIPQTPHLHRTPASDSHRCLNFSEANKLSAAFDSQRERTKQNHQSSFYEKLALHIETLNNIPERAELLGKCYNKPDYSEGVNLYRYKDGSFEEMKSIDTGLFRKDDDITNLELNTQNSHNNSKFTEDSKYIKKTIKNKGYLYQAILKQPLPFPFMFLLLTVIFGTLITATFCIVEYSMVKSVLDKITWNLELLAYQVKLNYYLSEASMWILQAIFINFNYLSLQNTYPGPQTPAVFINSTAGNIEKLIKKLNRILIKRESSVHQEILDRLCSDKVSYLYSVVGVTYNEIALENAYRLLINDLFTISKYESLQSFSFNDSTVSAFLYNANNPIVISWLTELVPYNERVLNSIDKEIATVSTLFFSFWGAIAAFFISLIFSMVLIRRIISRQALMMLQIPLSICRKQQQIATDLYNDARHTEAGNEVANNNFNSESEGGSDNNIEDDVDGAINANLDRHSASLRKFVEPCAINFDVIWRLLITLSVICFFYFEAYNISMDQLEAVKGSENAAINNSVIPLTFANIDYGLKIQFYNSSQKFRNKNDRNYLRTLVQQSMNQISNFQASSKVIFGALELDEEVEFAHFLYNSMCIEDFNDDCEDSSSKMSYFEVLSEVSHLQKIVLHQFSGPKNPINDTNGPPRNSSRNDTEVSLNAKSGINSEEMQRASELTYTYIIPGYFFMMDSIYDGIIELNGVKVSLLLMIFLAFICILSAVALFVWLPFIHRLKRMYSKLRVLMTLIPLDVALHIKTFHVYLSQILFKQKE